MPPESSDGRFDVDAVQMHELEAFVDALADLLSRCIFVCRRSGKAMFSKTDIESKSAPS